MGIGGFFKKIGGGFKKAGNAIGKPFVAAGKWTGKLGGKLGGIVENLVDKMGDCVKKGPLGCAADMTGVGPIFWYIAIGVGGLVALLVIWKVMSVSSMAERKIDQIDPQMVISQLARAAPPAPPAAALPIK